MVDAKQLHHHVFQMNSHAKTIKIVALKTAFKEQVKLLVHVNHYNHPVFQMNPHVKEQMIAALTTVLENQMKCMVHANSCTVLKLDHHAEN